MAAVRLDRHVVRLDDGHPVGIAIAGRGVPLVVVHGYTAQGIMYAQTLSRLVSMGFKVIAIDTPGHGRTPVPRCHPADLDAHAAVVRRTIDHLGIKQAMLAGHSLGGRLAAEVAAADPSRVAALILIDAIVGRPWDREARRLRRCPILGTGVLARLLLDTAATIPVMADPGQAAKLASLVLGAGWGRRPLRLIGPGLAILLARPSALLLDSLGPGSVPTVVIHGAADITVPMAAARDTAARLGATLAVIDGAPHSWLLRDPETLPAIIGHLLAGPLGDAWEAALRRAGLDPITATIPDIERALYADGALALTLTPPLSFTRTARQRRPARYRWELESA